MPTPPLLFGPPRPCAIATILNCEDTESLSSMQTLLHSIKATNNNHDENNTTDENNNNDENNIYKPEIITLVTGNISNEIRDEMLGCFCTRIIDIDNINAGNNNDYATNDNATNDNANLDVAKIHLFNQKVYEKILYIDSNCLVQKSVSHLFKLSNNNSSNNSDNNNSDNNNNDNDNLGLISANNNDNYDNNQGFGSNVILIQPSNELYKDMMNQVHANLSTNQSTADFWNTYFHNTWNQIPKENKLGIEYNYYNNSNNNNNSDLKHEDICIWNYNHDNNNNHSASISTRNKLYQKWYKKSQRYKENYREEQLLTQKAKHDSQLQQLKRKRQQKHMQQQLHQQQQQGATNNNHNNNPNETKKKQMEKHKLVTKRYKELRKEGKDPKESMRIARSDYGMDKDDERQQSPSAQVAKMFGMGGIV